MTFLKKFFITILGLLVLDVLAGVICKSVLVNIPYNGSPLSVDKHVLFEENSEVILMGASQVKHGYNPRVFSKVFGMSVYNAAQDGIDVIQNYIYLKSIFDRHIPQMVILDVSPIYINGSMKYRIRNLNNWYGLSNAVTEYFDSQATWQDKIKLKSNLFKYNSFIYNLFRTQIRSERDCDGFVPMRGSYEVKQFENKNFNIDVVELNYLDKIVDLCNNNHCQLVFSQAPNHTIDKEYGKWLRNYCKTHEIPLYDHSEDSSFIMHNHLFRDNSHLNDVGAAKYSLLLAHEIKEKISSRCLIINNKLE